MSEQEEQYEKTLQKGIRLLKESPNQTGEILKISTRLSYLRGRMFEQNELNEIRKALDIALEEINNLRSKLGYDKNNGN